MSTSYTDERNIQILVALMKHHGISRIIVSPGATNITFVASVQAAPYFTLWSAADERQAAYMACGMAAETGEPVALSCTGATASRNYLPGLTEAYYRKLPVLAVTSSQHLGRVGNMVPQVTDRSCPPPDTCLMSVQLPSVSTAEDERSCEVAANRALLELTHHGGGPVHVNLITTYSSGNARELPAAHAIDRVCPGDELPSLAGRRVAVFVGAHQAWDEALTEAVDAFCAAYDAVVVCDQTSNYRGPYRALAPLLISQTGYVSPCKHVDVLVHIGEISGSYAVPSAGETWRVSPDGRVADAFGSLRYVFEMGEREFFEAYAAEAGDAARRESFAREWRREDVELRAEIPELPFSNIWMAQQTAGRLPEASVLHLGILNSLRSWNLFETPDSVRCYCNTGGFGIDGCVSSLVGASLASPGKLFFGVVGDLAFFYDLNAVGNRHVASNIRLLVVNNGVGTEFKNYNHRAAAYGADADAFMAARGHYGNRSHELVRHYAEDLGFEYLAAGTKEEYLGGLERFLDPEPHEKPMLLEAFTDSQDESDALRAMCNLKTNAAGAAKGAVKAVLGDKGVAAVKKILGR